MLGGLFSLMGFILVWAGYYIREDKNEKQLGNVIMIIGGVLMMTGLGMNTED